MILLPLADTELALVRKALRALSLAGDDRDIRINIETSMTMCRKYPLTPRTVRILEAMAYS